MTLQNNLTRLTETTCFESTADSIDEENGIIKGVKILGRLSKNGREYSEKSRQDAAKCYEGIGVNLDHLRTGGERSVRDAGGWLAECVAKPDGVYGNLYLLKTDPQTPKIFEIARRNPNRIGLSHVAEGVVRAVGGKNVVESIQSVQSVDLVQNPATNKGLFESEEPVSKKTLREFVDGIKGEHPEKSKLQKLLESDPAMGGMAMSGMAAGGEPDGDEGDTDAQVKTAFESAIVAAFRDPALDTKATLAKIKAMLKAYDTLATDTQTPAAGAEGGNGAGSAGAGAGGTGKKTMESVEAELASLKARDAARTLLESCEVKSTPVRVAALAGLSSEEDRKALVEDWKQSDAKAATPAPPAKPAKPRSGSVLSESDGGGKSYDEMTKGGFAKALV
jgi:hypothetical protein